jgi:hypothetical protein
MKRALLSLLLAVLTSAPLHAGKPAEPQAGRPREPKTVELTCPAHFEEKGQYTQLVLKGGGRETFRFNWRYAVNDHTLLPVDLKEGETYSFKVVKPAESYDLPRIVRVERAGKALYDVTVCEVHGAAMDYKSVPIHYGIACGQAGDPPWEVARKEFPHWREYACGGCVITEEKTEFTYVCPDCLSALADWRKKQK